MATELEDTLARLCDRQMKAIETLTDQRDTLKATAKDVLAWADTPAVNNNSQRTESIMKLRAAVWGPKI